MTKVIEVFLNNSDLINWSSEVKLVKDSEPTWKNIRRKVEEYLKKYPGSSDKDIASLTGFTVGQVGIITGNTHRKTIRNLNKAKSPAELARLSNVTLRFATRIWDQAHGKKKISKYEAKIWE